MGTAPKTPGKAMYVAAQSDEDWLRNAQRKLYARSKEQLDYVFGKLWGLVTDLHNLRMAMARVSRNRGARTAGVDGLTVRKILASGAEDFIARLRAELRSQSYRPSPVRQVLIPKRGQPGKHRALGIPTVKDRVVQAAMKHVLEPIFEADFFPVSYGFRPGKSVHGALERLRVLLRPKQLRAKDDRRLPYQWAVEGDIKGCFDHIDHHALMDRVRRRVSDSKVNRMIVAFLKAGILSEEQLQRTDFGTPQGGILSPLLANIALTAIEERYERHVWPRRIPTTRRDAAPPEKRAETARRTDRRRGRPIVYPLRYADDFILLVAAPVGPEQYERAREIANNEKDALATDLKERLGLELSEDKTLVTPVTSSLAFLGHHVKVRTHPQHGRLVSTAVVPKERSQRLRRRIKEIFGRHSLGRSLAVQLQLLNPILRGWGSFYRHAWGAKRVFGAIDYHAWWTISRWLRKKHPRVSVRALHRRYRLPQKPGTRTIRWADAGEVLFSMSSLRVEPYWLDWERLPSFAIHQGKPGA